MTDELRTYIKRRKEELNAIIMAHFYQIPEIQDIADFVGDSLELARRAAATEAEVIFFCGVNFMAESAKILSPQKLVILPEARAGCPMADMITAGKLRKFKDEHPEFEVVCYVNSSAEVKAESDICCTSSNAVEVVKSIPESRGILFVPDQNLASFVAQKTGREIKAWPGYCPVHHHISREDILVAKKEHPEAVVLVHPECRPEVVELADEALSTGGMLKYVEKSEAKEFIIGTEEGLLYQLKKRNPDKTFYLAHKEFLCPDMKLTTLEKLALAVEKMEPVVEVPEGVREKAYRALERMLSVGPSPSN